MSRLASILKVVGSAEYSPPVALDTGYEQAAVTSNVAPRGIAVGGDQRALFAAALDSITLRLDNIVTAIKASMFVSADADGDVPLTPVSVDRPVTFGQTTTDAGSVSFDGGDVAMSCVVDQGDLTLDANGNVVLYLWIKLDNGTADLVSAEIVTHP